MTDNRGPLDVELSAEERTFILNVIETNQPILLGLLNDLPDDSPESKAKAQLMVTNIDIMASLRKKLS